MKIIKYRIAIGLILLISLTVRSTQNAYAYFNSLGLALSTSAVTALPPPVQLAIVISTGATLGGLSVAGLITLSVEIYPYLKNKYHSNKIIPIETLQNDAAEFLAGEKPSEALTESTAQIKSQISEKLNKLGLPAQEITDEECANAILNGQVLNTPTQEETSQEGVRESRSYQTSLSE